MKPMEWISASDRLPGHEEMVLAIVTGQFGGIRLETAYEFATYSPVDGWTLDTWPEVEEPAFTVSHWMELPEPPGTPKPNGDYPLTMDELLEMDGEPVWQVDPGRYTGWALVRVWSKRKRVVYLTQNNGLTTLAEFLLREAVCGIYRSPRALRWLQSPVEDGNEKGGSNATDILSG